MGNQIQKGTTYTTVSPGNVVTAQNLNALSDASILLKGAVVNQSELTVPDAGDTVLASDASNSTTDLPVKVQLQNLPVAAGISNKTEMTALADDDVVPVVDTSDSTVTVPKKVKAINLLPESRKYGQEGFVSSSTYSSGVYALTMSNVTGYTQGMTVKFIANTANTTSSTAVNINSLGAKTIHDAAGDDLTAGDIASGALVTVTYDGTYFQLVNQKATGSESVSPTNSFTANPITFTHGLGSTPHRVRWVARCIVSDLDYEIGDEIDVQSISYSDATGMFTEAANATTCKLYTRYTTGRKISYKAGSDMGTMTSTSWVLVCYASLH